MTLQCLTIHNRIGSIMRSAVEQPKLHYFDLLWICCRPSTYNVYLFYNLWWICSNCSGLVVQPVVQRIHDRSKQVEFGLTGRQMGALLPGDHWRRAQDGIELSSVDNSPSTHSSSSAISHSSKYVYNNNNNNNGVKSVACSVRSTWLPYAAPG